MSTLTIEKASKLSTFELRNELVKRNALDIPENLINYESLLARLIKDLVKEEDENQNNETIQSESTDKEVIKDLKKLREVKKQAAKERSNVRQENVTYFKHKKESNQEYFTQLRRHDLQEQKTSELNLKDSTDCDDIPYCKECYSTIVKC
jgi:phage terminase small subunit